MVQPDNYSNEDAEEFPWDELIKLIDREQVIPIVGSEVYQVGNQALYEVIASEIAHAPVAADRHAFHKMAGRFLQPKEDKAQNKDHTDLNVEIDKIVARYKLDDFPWLGMLAQIKKFRLYVNTTYDDLLYRALQKAGRNVKALVYTPTEKDLDGLAEGLEFINNKTDSAIVFNVFGNTTSTKPSYDEKDLIENIAHLQGDMQSNSNRFFKYLNNRSHLFVGCSYKNWLMRFVARSITNMPFDPGAAQQRRFFSNNVLLDDLDYKDLQRFLRDYQSRIFYNGSTADFLQSMRVQANDMKWVVDKHTTFVSFSGAQRPLADKLNDFFKKNDIKTWFDQEARGEGRLVSDTIRKAIKISKVFVAVVTPEYNDKLYQARETDWVSNYNEDNPADETAVITITLGKVDVGLLPRALTKRFWLQLPSEDLEDHATKQALKRVLDEVRAVINV